MADINMRIILSALGAQSAVSAISSIGNSMGGLNKVLLGVGVAAGAAAIGLGVTAVKAAGDFQQSLTTLSTGAGESASNLKMVGDGILSLASSTGTSTKQLTDGMFMIESAGYHGKAGLDVLTAAARGAKVGQADLGVVSDATTTIMTDFSSKNVTASQAVNTLIAVVSNGKTSMQALSSSLSGILPTASAAGISLTDTAAAMATMTGEGIPAAQASTYLRQTIVGLEAPSKQTVTALAGIGLSSKQVSDEMKVSLPGALQLITDHLKKKFPEGSAAYVNALKDISGGSKTMQGMLDLTGSHLATFKGNVENVASSVKKGGSSINGWSQVQQNFNFKMDQAKEALNVLMIKIGQGLLPAVTQLMGSVVPLISQFTDWIVKSGALQNITNFVVGAFKNLVAIGSNVVSFFQHNTAAMEALKVTGLVVAGVVIASLVVGFYTWAAAAGAAAIATLAATWPFLAIGAAIGLVVGGFILAYNKIQPFHDLVNGIAQSISSNFLPILHMIGNFLVATFTPVWNQLVQVWQTQIMPSVNQLIAALSPLLTVLKMIGLVIGGVFVVALGLIIGSISGIIGAIAGFLQGLAIAFGGLVQIFTGIVQIISGIVTFIVDLFTGHFDKLQGDLKGILGGITNIFSGFGTMVRGIFTGLIKGVTGGVSGFATGILGFFNQIAHGADNHTQHARDVATLHTLQMKDQSLQHTQQMAQQSVGHLQQEAQGIEQQIKTAKDSVTRHHLEMKLKAVEQTIAMKQAVVGHCQEMRTQVAVQMTQMREAVNGKTISMRDAAKIHTLEMKDAVLKNDQETEKGQLKILDQQAQDVQREYSKAKDNATRTKLREKFEVIQHQIETKKGVLQHTTDMRKQVESQLDTLRKGASDRFGSIQKDIKNIVGNVTSWLKNAWNNTVKWVVDKFKFLYDHNYYFKNLVDSIKTAFDNAKKWITDTWNSVTTWLTGKWDDLVKKATKLWEDISKPFKDAWTTYISPALTSLWNSITTWWSGTVVPAATTLGSNIINAIGDGISSAAGAVNDAIQGAINSALKGLGFHDLPGMPKHAAGIIDNPVGHLATIGEEGPELMVIGASGPGSMYIPKGASIYPHSVYTELIAGGNGALGGASASAARAAAASHRGTAPTRQNIVHIQQLQPELHIHTNNTRLDHAQIQEIIDRAAPQFGQAMADQIRAQFGNI